MERVLLALQGAMYHELYSDERGSKAQEILERTSNLLNEIVSNELSDEQQVLWEIKHGKRIEAMRSMMYFMGITGFIVWNEEEENFHNELFRLLKKYDLIWAND
ncbi:hypothetical protein D3C84_707110 [compost metagenome]